MRTFTIIPVLVVLFCSASVSAQDILVAYTDGLVEYEDGGSWYEVFIGDQIPSDAQVRVSDGGFVEFDNGGSKIQITRPGMYAMNTLLASARVASASTGGAGRLGRLVNSRPPDTSTSAVGGVRASEAVDRDQTLWAGDADAMALIRDGLDMIEAGDYQSAYWYFEEAYDAAEQSEEATVGFYYGFTSALLGNTAEATAILERYEPDPTTPYYDDHALVLARLLVQSAQYEEGLKVLDSYLQNGSSDPGLRQEAQLLRGVGFSAMGNTTEAKAALNEAVSLVPDSPDAATAQELLSTM